MKYTRDVRTPADPQDFESLYDRPAKPPRDFRVVKADGTLTFEFQDFSGTPERDPTVAYRAYFVPASAATAKEMGQPTVRAAALRLARLAASVQAGQRGEWVRTSDAKYHDEAGSFLAVGVNRRNVESEPTIAYVAVAPTSGGIVVVLDYSVKTLVNATPTAFATVALADGGAIAGEVLYRVVAADGASRQSLHGHLSYSAARDGATYATNSAEVGTQHSSCTTGTLAGSMSVAGASDVLTLTATFTSSLGAPTVTLYYRVYQVDTATVTGV